MKPFRNWIEPLRFFHNTTTPSRYDMPSVMNWGWQRTGSPINLR